MTDYINLIIPCDWQIRVQVEAVDGYAARMAEAKRYGAMADALEAAQAENAQWRVDFKEMLIERDAALARLAEIEKQEPIYQYQRADGGWIDQTKNGYDYNVRYGAATVRILYAAAGASPVEPSLARVVEPFEVDWPEYHQQAMGCGLEDHGIRDRYEAMQYGWDQAIERVAERLPETLYATPQAAAQPPAPSEAAITYMTGYSDGREWAAAPQPKEKKWAKIY